MALSKIPGRSHPGMKTPGANKSRSFKAMDGLVRAGAALEVFPSRTLPPGEKNMRTVNADKGPHPSDDCAASYGGPDMTDKGMDTGRVAEATPLKGKGPIMTPGKNDEPGKARRMTGHNQGFQRPDQPKDN